MLPPMIAMCLFSSTCSKEDLYILFSIQKSLHHLEPPAAADYVDAAGQHFLLADTYNELTCVRRSSILGNAASSPDIPFYTLIQRECFIS